ncbi:hypothetical protein IVA88_24900 [Bradyrhizobium sp. 149]|uniref:hypothetical protein n=1 Tax=Bradyrhizobium sp. 149 TaxID=2782624 RepID=UPI001FFC2543|nr:hypothetical protein [Bradyrhizobium sp. 149]MCK1654660.1 hypothetical protein [Bradyrhizobium sp. 149]
MWPALIASPAKLTGIGFLIDQAVTGDVQHNSVGVTLTSHPIGWASGRMVQARRPPAAPLRYPHRLADIQALPPSLAPFATTANGALFLIA